MGSPANLRSLDAVQSTGAGSHTRTKGHCHITMLVAAANLDAANDTLEVAFEGSADGDRWTEIDRVTAADFNSDATSGEFTAEIGRSGRYYEFLRARVDGFTDASGDGDLSVDAWVMAGGFGGPGGRGNPEHHPRS